MSTSSSKHNLAARMAVWSGRHRKKAFWGWLAFVVVVFMVGNMVGTTSISDVDQFSGESHKAEVREKLADAESLVQSEESQLTTTRRQFDAGEIDRLALRSAELELETARLGRVDAEAEPQQSIGLLEDAIEQPVTNDE